jgi:hypothetical protein
MSAVFEFEAQAAPMRAAAAERFPEEFQENLRNMIADVEQNVAAKALDVGEAAPDFALHQAGTEGERSLADALANGPVVLSFYRGQW